MHISYDIIMHCQCYAASAMPDLCHIQLNGSMFLRWDQAIGGRAFTWASDRNLLENPSISLYKHMHVNSLNSKKTILMMLKKWWHILRMLKNDATYIKYIHHVLRQSLPTMRKTCQNLMPSYGASRDPQFCPDSYCKNWKKKNLYSTWFSSFYCFNLQP